MLTACSDKHLSNHAYFYWWGMGMLLSFGAKRLKAVTTVSGHWRNCLAYMAICYFPPCAAAAGPEDCSVPCGAQAELLRWGRGADLPLQGARPEPGTEGLDEVPALGAKERASLVKCRVWSGRKERPVCVFSLSCLGPGVAELNNQSISEWLVRPRVLGAILNNVVLDNNTV